MTTEMSLKQHRTPNGFSALPQKSLYSLTKGILKANYYLILKQGAAKPHENPERIIPNNADDIQKRNERLPTLWA
jgi:hypothetical protein